MSDLFQKIKENKGPLGKWANKAEGYFVFPELKGSISNIMEFNGNKVIMWSVNDYLGLANNKEILEFDTNTIKECGIAYPMGGRMMTGETNYHTTFENELAEFMGKEKALLLNFGYQGLFSVIDALVNKNDVIVYDRDSHACIVDGVRLHIGKRFTFKNNDIESLEVNLKRATKITEKTGGGILVISEGVFGMRGEQGILKEIVALKKKYDFKFLIDDAHGFGTLGDNGNGTGFEQNCQDGIDVYFATFTKAMAGIGAFVVGDKFLIDYLKYNTRSQMYAKSLPLVMVKSGLKRLKMIKENPQFKHKLWQITKKLQWELKNEGFDIGKTNSCITPIFLKVSIPEAMSLVYDLRENHKIFCSIIIYPVIPKGLLLLRLIPTASHTFVDVERSIKAFLAVRSKLESGLYLKH